MKHLALKCVYNDGGNQNGRFIGFAGTCSPKQMELNVAGRGRWCSNSDCQCFKFINGSRRLYPTGPCYESKIFHGDWGFGSGETAAGRPIRFQIDGPGGYAILTTVPPNDEERHRRIFGFFKIRHVFGEAGNPAGGAESTWLQSSRAYTVRLSWDDARRLYFWDYYANKSGGPRWSSRLNRELSNAQVKAILMDIMKWTEDSRVRSVTARFLNADFCGVAPFPKESGERSKSPTKPIRHPQQWGGRGGGGEGPDHLRLKKWIASHPEEVGVNRGTHGELEHPYLSGDEVDVCFDEGDGKFTIVEIETDHPHPAGSHQVIKYRALKCSEEGYELDDSRVRGVLVAWSFPRDCREFCKKYGIELFENRR